MQGITKELNNQYREVLKKLRKKGETAVAYEVCCLGWVIAGNGYQGLWDLTVG